MHYRKLISCLLLALVGILSTVLLGACGKKAPPVPPGTIRPKRIKDLKATASNNGIILTWTVPTRNINGSPLIWIKSFAIYRAELSPGQCTSCPVSYPPPTIIPYNKGIKSPKKQIRYEDLTAMPGKLYVYQVRIIKGWRNESDMSNRASICWKCSKKSSQGCRSDK